MTFEEAKQVVKLVKQQTNLRPITREQVKKMRGEWVPFKTIGGASGLICERCKYREYDHVKYAIFNFCPCCGSPMTDEAVDILWKRLEAMQNAAD